MNCFLGDTLTSVRGIFGHRLLLFPRSHYNGTINWDLVNISTGGQLKNCSAGDMLSFLLLSPARVARLVHNTRLCVNRLLRC